MPILQISRKEVFERFYVFFFTQLHRRFIVLLNTSTYLPTYLPTICLPIAYIDFEFGVELFTYDLQARESRVEHVSAGRLRGSQRENLGWRGEG